MRPALPLALLLAACVPSPASGTGGGSSASSSSASSSGSGGAGGQGGAPASSSSSSGGGWTGDCTSDADCDTSLDGPCGTEHCIAGSCRLVPVAAHTPIGTQMAGDCRTHACDGAGGEVDDPDPNDFVNDLDPCTWDHCDGLQDTHTPWPMGATCGTMTIDNPDPMTPGQATVPKACNASGACVPACADGVRDQNETDVDCGGVFPCAPCANGKACNTFQDCASARCLGGLCEPCLAGGDCASGVCVGGVCK